jgi:hypothetical protein
MQNASTLFFNKIAVHTFFYLTSFFFKITRILYFRSSLNWGCNSNLFLYANSKKTSGQKSRTKEKSSR